MHKSKYLSFLLAAILLLLAVPQSFAQSCASASIIIDATISVDESAICDAAQPLADEGYNVLVYLTDFAPANEDEWFLHLDDVETQAGLRNGDQFRQNALAIESSTVLTSDWSHSITVGEALYGSAVDSAAGGSRIKQPLIAAVGDGDFTGGVVSALGISSELLASSAGTAVTDNGSNSNGATSTSSGGGVGTLLAAVVGVGAVGAAGAYAYPRIIKPAREKRKRDEEWVGHLATIQERVSNLLLALEQLVGGSQPEEAILYQLFEMYNGNGYPDLDKQVRSWVSESQSAITDVFNIRSRLLDDDIQKERGLEQLVTDWEKIYVTLTGSQERILNLTDKELHTLLDPLLVLETKPQNSKLTGQLDELNRSLEGVPLKVELQTIKPSDLDEAGVLGNVDAIQAEIGRLQAAQDEAPEGLEATRRDRLEAAREDADAPFVVAEADRFEGIDLRLTAAEDLIIEGLHLRAIEEIEYAEDLLEAVGSLKAAESIWATRSAEISQIESEGYNAPQLKLIRNEIEEDVAKIATALRTGDPDDAINWVTEFDADGQTALTQAKGWRDMALRNTGRLDTLRKQVDLTTKQEYPAAIRAWQRLQSYPEPNWKDLSKTWQEMDGNLQKLPNQLDKIDELNSVKMQSFADAERHLTKAEREVESARLHLASVRNRIDEVVSAETNIDGAIMQTRDVIKQAIALRDVEDAKISSGIDESIIEATERLKQAVTAREAHNYVLAIHEQSHSYETATTAYKDASEQVATINQLQHRINDWVDNRNAKLEARLRKAAERDTHMHSPETVQKLRDAQATLSKGHQTYHAAEAMEDDALAANLAKAVALFESAESGFADVEALMDSEEAAWQEQFNQATKSVNRAHKAVASAYRAGDRMHTGNHWRTLADRARDRQPKAPNSTMTMAELEKLEERAEETWKLAVDAERSADEARQKREQQRQSMGGGSYGGGGGYGRGRSFPRRTIIGGGGMGGMGGGVGRRSQSTRRSSRSTGSFGGGSSRGAGGGFGGSSRRSSGGGGGSRRR